jgi:uncharacterized protein YcfJ
MNQDNRNWILVAGSAIGALAGGIPGAIIGGLLGAIIKEFTCPICKGVMKEYFGNYLRCEKCGHTVRKN